MTAVGPRGGVYHRGGTVRGSIGRAMAAVSWRCLSRRGLWLSWRRLYRGGYGGWARPGWYRWGPGGAIAAGAAMGVLLQVRPRLRGLASSPGTVLVLYRPQLPQGFWDACQ